MKSERLGAVISHCKERKKKKVADRVDAQGSWTLELQFLPLHSNASQ